MKIENEIIELFAEKLNIPVEDVAPKAEIEVDLGADSLDCVELLMCVEEKYDIDISDADAEKVVTVQDVIDYLKKRDKNLTC